MSLAKCPLTDEERNNMIAEAAFLKYRQRDTAGDPVADWLNAEAELNDALAANCRLENVRQERSVYRRMRAEARRMLEKAEETVNAETIRQALARVAADLRKTGDIFPGTVDRASKAVKQEIDKIISRLGQSRDRFRSEKKLLSGWKDKSTQTWSRAAKSFQQRLARWRGKGDN